MGPKPKNNTTYRPQWRTEVHTNLDGIEELYDWVSPAPNDTSKVKCSLCVKSIPFPSQMVEYPIVSSMPEAKHTGSLSKLGVIVARFAITVQTSYP